ncbi:TIGR03086 family metal-binding protein [Pseudonocardia nigra]|uniref:TIGR03086 family metal-binding protein n=1 Tax=Pseudonocardia nigra TaxID=1921578 RepID=UPI001C604026|nr:TIGR03086 family metal-binding protein [Pseudonocardia nigra]
MDSADHMSRSIDLAVTAIRGAGLSRYDDPTPCRDYTVRDVVNHIAFGLLLAHRSATREAWDPSWTGESRTPFLVGRPETEWADACAAEAAATARAWVDPAAWEGEAHMGGSPMPAATVGSIMTAEFAVHAWDLAVATGRTVDIPPGLGEVVLEGVVSIAPAGRDGGWFAAAVAVPAEAGAFERALGESGRDPGWTPSR